VSIQVGAFSKRENAERARETLLGGGFDPVLVTGLDGIVRVLLERVSVRDIDLTKEQLSNIGYSGAFIRQEK
jgi:hypothetical protein